MISPEEGKEALEALFALSITTIPLTLPLCQKAFEWAQRLQHSKLYDSLYIALTEQENAQFWTGDKRLFNGARQRGFTQIHWINDLE